MATLATLTLDIEEQLFGIPQIERPVEDTLATAVSNASDTTWQFTTDTLWRRGDYAELVGAAGAASELVILAGDQSGAADVTVRRAQRQTTAVSSASTGDVVRRNPLFPRVLIARAINETIDSDISPDCWYRSQRTITPATKKARYDVNASDYLVEQVWQVDTNQTSIGTATFANATDRWTTSTAHGLSVGDAVRFTAVGTGATGYAVTTPYWVITVVSTTVVELSATENGSILAAADDSVGTWTMAEINGFEFVPLHPGAWEVVTNVDTTTTSTTGRIIRLKGGYATADTIHYAARTHPSSAAISSLPTDIADFVPWGAMARLLSWVAVPSRVEGKRGNRVSDRVGPNQAFVEAQFYASKFEDAKRRYKRKLLRELDPPNRYRTNRQWRG